MIVGAFWRAASAAPTALSLWQETFRALAERPERLSEVLVLRRVPPPAEVLAELIDTAQRRGEMRNDHPAPFLAGVILTAVWANALREGPAGVMTTRLPAPGSGIRTSHRSLVVTLLVDGLRKTEPVEEETSRTPVPDRIGRRRDQGADSGERPARPARPARLEQGKAPSQPTTTRG
ncbi:MAG: hypothetical protein M3Y91_04695 [Actinomycetota bacterium]|nr:hypothetical protein [Actinomycetota bacterium]